MYIYITPATLSYDTTFNILLVVFQALVAIVCCYAAKAAGKIGEMVGGAKKPRKTLQWP